MQVSLESYWEHIYQEKNTDQLSWIQALPQPSLDIIRSCGLSTADPVIDIGGGDSRLADHLLDMGFRDISVLDISENALSRACVRLGEHAVGISWIHSDILAFRPDKKYSLWHDRAAFHFLIQPEDVRQYARIAADALPADGHMIIGAFSKSGPDKCSGLPVQQYDWQSMEAAFSGKFDLIGCQESVHHTPSGAGQEYIFCHFERNRN